MNEEEFKILLEHSYGSILDSSKPEIYTDESQRIGFTQKKELFDLAEFRINQSLINNKAFYDLLFVKNTEQDFKESGFKIRKMGLIYKLTKNKHVFYSIIAPSHFTKNGEVVEK